MKKIFVLESSLWMELPEIMALHIILSDFNMAVVTRWIEVSYNYTEKSAKLPGQIHRAGVDCSFGSYFIRVMNGIVYIFNTCELHDSVFKKSFKIQQKDQIT